jgi:hypothetical protein
MAPMAAKQGWGKQVERQEGKGVTGVKMWPAAVRAECEKQIFRCGQDDGKRRDEFSLATNFGQDRDGRLPTDESEWNEQGGV